MTSRISYLSSSSVSSTFSLDPLTQRLCLSSACLLEWGFFIQSSTFTSFLNQPELSLSLLCSVQTFTWPTRLSRHLCNSRTLRLVIQTKINLLFVTDCSYTKTTNFKSHFWLSTHEFSPLVYFAIFEVPSIKKLWSVFYKDKTKTFIVTNYSYTKTTNYMPEHDCRLPTLYVVFEPLEHSASVGTECSCQEPSWSASPSKPTEIFPANPSEIPKTFVSACW